jgi:hypothetical protein
MLYETIFPFLVLVIVDQAHRQFVLLQQEAVGVFALRFDGTSKGVQRIL